MMTAHNNYFIITQGQASRLFPNEHDPQTPDWYMYAHMDMWDGFILYLQYQNSVSLLQKGACGGFYKPFCCISVLFRCMKYMLSLIHI